MILFLVVFKTFSTFHFQTLWCLLVWISLFYWFMQILESIGLSILPSWEILWQKYLFIVCLFIYLPFLSSTPGTSMIEMSVSLLLSYKSLWHCFFLFCVFCSYWVNSTPQASISLFYPLFNSLFYWIHSVRFECLICLFFCPATRHVGS